MNAARNPIDAFITARLEKEGLKPSAEADRTTLIRRLSFDLLGLPPTPEEVQSFLKDSSPVAYEKLVDRFLASPRYGERWARHWLDVVRFAETHGFEMNQPRANAWPYRDYVIRAFNEDKPYDRFIVEQIAGDALAEDAATGFLVAGPWDQVKSPDEVLTKNQRADELHDMVSTTGSAFLGLTVGCARCHNHKFDPISQRDYFGIKAIFEGVQHGERAVRFGDEEQRQKRAKELQRELAAIEERLVALEPLAAGSSGSPGKLRSPVNARLNVDRFAPVEVRFVRFSISETTDLEPCIDELEVFPETDLTNNFALASRGVKVTASGTYVGNPSHKLEHLNDGRYGNGRSWISNEGGKGWVKIEFPKVERIARVLWSRDRSPERRYNDRVATKYRIEVSTDGDRWTTVASHEDRMPYKSAAEEASGVPPEVQSLLKSRKALESQIKGLTSASKIYAGEFKEPEPTRRFQRGDPMQPREIVAPAVLSQVAISNGLEAAGASRSNSPLTPALSPLRGEGERVAASRSQYAVSGRLPLSTNTPERQRRLVLANWIVSTDNPLTARVLVNRLWQYHFGEGLVSTPSDFGANGARPTHPELLDWMAIELMESSWSIKHIQRLIVTSTTYRQRSATRTDCLAADAGTRLLWRFPPRRLEAEAIRDSMLAAAGRLNLRMGGPGWSPFEPNDNYVRVYEPKQKFGAADFRRMIYATVVRQRPDGVFGAFDCPDGGQIAPRRSRSTTPLQALNLLNSGFTMQVAGFLAQRIEREATQEPDSQVKRVFSLAFNREPTADELRASAEFVREQGLQLFCRAMFNANEFIYVF